MVGQAAREGGNPSAALRREALNSGSASSTCVLPSVVCPRKATTRRTLLSLPPLAWSGATRCRYRSSDARVLSSVNPRSKVSRRLLTVAPLLSIVASQVSAILMVLATCPQPVMSPPVGGGSRGPKIRPPGGPPGGPPRGAPGGPPRGPRGPGPGGPPGGPPEGVWEGGFGGSLGGRFWGHFGGFLGGCL